MIFNSNFSYLQMKNNLDERWIFFFYLFKTISNNLNYDWDSVTQEQY